MIQRKGDRFQSRSLNFFLYLGCSVRVHMSRGLCVCEHRLRAGTFSGRCLSQNPKCKTHPKAHSHLQPALNVKIISQPSSVLRLQPAMVTLGLCLEKTELEQGKGGALGGQRCQPRPAPHTPPATFRSWLLHLPQPAEPWPGVNRAGGVVVLVFSSRLLFPSASPPGLQSGGRTGAAAAGCF